LAAAKRWITSSQADCHFPYQCATTAVDGYSFRIRKLRVMTAKVTLALQPAAVAKSRNRLLAEGGCCSYVES
jgi:hypothetical protein